MKGDTPRIYIIFGCVVLASALIVWKLFLLGYLDHSFYAQTSEAQTENIANVMARGNIYIQDPTAATGTTQYVVATNKQFPFVYAIPLQVTDPASAAAALAPILNLDPTQLQTTLSTKSTTTAVLADKISDQAVSQINTLNIAGIGVRYETDRYYPAGTMLSSVLGFFGYSDQGRAGQYGVEAYFDSELSGTATDPQASVADAGKPTLWSRIKNFFSLSGAFSAFTDVAPQPADVTLTIDRNVQAFVENELQTTIQKWHASGGTVIVQDPQTGKIIAMADDPDFDPNNYSASDPGNYLNRSVQAVFEPGSSFKPITMAAGLDLGKITPDTTYTDPGVVNIDGYQIHNFDDEAHGTVSMTTVLEDSLNTGAMFVENLIGDTNFQNYVANFGFGQDTGIDLPGEVSGDITNLYSGRKINNLTASFGQGIAVTPLQLINAYSAIANGGKLMKPYVVDHITYADGQTVTTQPEVESIPITQKTSQLLTGMLVNVVDLGFDKARIPGYSVAGKTGTAQIPAPGGGYEVGTFIHDFLGFAPASNPKFVVLVKMDRPQGITFASDSLSPTFRDIAAYLLNYYHIPPDRS